MGAMRSARKSLLAAVVVAVLVGPLGGGEAGAGAEPRATTRTVTIPASAFNPASDDVAFRRGASFLETTAGDGTFLAPVYFDAPDVRVIKVVFFAIDSGIAFPIFEVYRTQLAVPQNVLCGEGATQGSSDTMQVVTVRDLEPRRVTGAYGMTLSVYLPAPYTDGYQFLGAKVTYSY